MKQRLRLCLLAAALACAFSPRAPAQTIRPGVPVPPAPRLSRVPIQGGIDPGVADEFLRDRLQQAQTSAELERLLTDLVEHPDKHGITRKERDTLKGALDKAPGRPEKVLEDKAVRDIILKAAKEHQEGGIDATPEERRRWEEFARRYGPPRERDPPGPDGPNHPGEDPFDPRPEGKPDGPGKLPDNPPPPPGPGPADPAAGPPPAPPAPPPAPPANSGGKDPLRNLTDSPAFRQMLANLDRAKGSGTAGSVNWNKLEQRFADIGMRLPNVSWPKVNVAPARERPSPAALPAGGPDAPAWGAGQVVLLLLAAATAALLAWGLLRRQGGLLLRGAGGGWRLGPWPVRPEAVRTRDELVRAFEYLALLLLGPAARSRNHREIAASLGESDASRRAAAQRLAGLYEQARYAPLDEALPDADLAGARADLSLLAGVAAA